MRENENLLPLVAETKKEKSDDTRLDDADAADGASGAVSGIVHDSARSTNGRQMDNKGLNGWLPSGTRQEDTWNKADIARQHSVVVT